MIHKTRKRIIGSLPMAVGLVMAAVASSAAGQTIAYTVASNAAYSYVDISQTGSQVLAGADDSTAVVNIGFPFKFYGQTYTSLCASVNGLIAFGGCNPDFANLDLTSQSPPPAQNLPLIAPFWGDLAFLMPGAGSVVYQALGASPNRKFVVQWQNVFWQNTLSPMNFQVVLMETSNVVLFQFKNVTPGVPAVDKGAGATVGIRAIDGQANKNRVQFSYKAPALHDAMAITFSPPTPVGSLADVSAKVTVTRSGLTFNRFNNTYAGTLTVKNTSTAAIVRPITVLLTGLPAGVQASNAAGVFPGNATIPAGPYFNLPGTTNLAVGASAVLSLTFTGANTPTFAYTTKVYSGPF